MTEFPTHAASVEEIFTYAGNRKVGFTHLLFAVKTQWAILAASLTTLVVKCTMLHRVTAIGTTFSHGAMMDFSIVDSLNKHCIRIILMDSLENKIKLLGQSLSEKNPYGKEKKKYRKMFNRAGRRIQKLLLRQGRPQ